MDRTCRSHVNLFENAEVIRRDISMADKVLYKALFSAARVAARTLVLQPHRIKTDLARKSVSAAAQEIGKAAGRAVGALFASSSVSSSAFKSLLSSKAPPAGRSGGSWPGRGGGGGGGGGTSAR